MHHRINEDKGSEQPPIFNRVSQNVAAAAMLVRTMPEPSTTEGRRVHGELQDLLETAVVQQAKSSTSRRRDAISDLPSAPHQQGREASVCPKPVRVPAIGRVPPVHDRLDNRREAQGDHEVVGR